jgi:hypothetical protein
MHKRPESILSVPQAEADLSNLESRAGALEAELAGVRAEIDRIKIYLELANRYGGGTIGHDSAAPMPSDQLNGAAQTAISANSMPLGDETLIEACRGKSIPDAAIALIRLAGRPLSEEEIVDGLRRGGVTLVSEVPVVNLRFALLRKRRETSAVRMTKDKLWDLGDDDAAHEDEFSQSGFVQNRNRNEHAERSRQGLLAARERGVKHGARSKITDEIKEMVETLMAKKVPAIEIARQAGISVNTYYRWIALGFVNRMTETHTENDLAE